MPTDPGNLLLVNGRIYPSPPWTHPTNALAIREGIVVAHGEEALQLKSNYTADHTIDVRGAVVLPGFTDGHIHLTALGESLTSLSFDETSNLQQIRDTMRKEASNRPPDEWITGGKWSLDALGEFPDRSMLDDVAPDNPVALHSKDLHSLWLNSRALAALDITTDTADPKGGKIPRNTNGQPTGILQENAIRMYENRRPPRDVEALSRVHRAVSAHCYNHGITAVHSIESLEDWDLYRELHRQGKLGLRIGGLLPLDNLDRIIERGTESGAGDDWLWTIGIKIFTDGALGSWTAWMKQPYENSGDRGMLLLSEDDLVSSVHRCHRHALSVGVHAIGDAAVAMTLRALQSSGAQEHRDHLIDRIEHFQLIDPDDLEMIPAGLIAAMQPIHLPGDREPAGQFWGERSRYAYAFQSLEKNGAVLAFGSDAPVEDVNPWISIQAAVARRLSAAEEPWNPREKTSLGEAVAAYTVNNARAAYREGTLGSLTVSAAGDAVVLDRNPWEIPETELGTVRPMMTILNGNVVFADGAA